MSWYGTTLYEFKKLFDKFRFKNNQNQDKIFPNLPEEDRIWEYQATSLNEYDALTMSTGNAWLSFMPSGEVQEIDQDTKELLKHEILLYHNPAQTIDLDYDVGLMYKNTLTPDTVINITIDPEKEYLNCRSRRFDAAGHATKNFTTQRIKIDVSELQRAIALNASNITDIQAQLKSDESLVTQVSANTAAIDVLKDKMISAETRIDNLEVLVGAGGEGEGTLDSAIAQGINDKLNALNSNKLPYDGGQMKGTLKAQAINPIISQIRNISLVSEKDKAVPNLSNGDICIIYEESGGVAGDETIPTIKFAAPTSFPASTSISEIMEQVQQLEASKVSYTGGQMTGALIASSNEDYKVAQTRNIVLLTKGSGAPTNVTNGTICFFYSTSAK